MPGHDDDAECAPFTFDDWLADHYGALLKRFAFVAGNGIDPRDVVQTLVAVVYAKFSADPMRFPDPQALFHYGGVVGRNLALTWLANSANEVSGDTLDSAMPASDPAEWVPLAHAIRHALDRVVPQHRRAILLSAQGMTAGDMARELGLPNENAARQTLWRARRSLHRVLAESPSAPWAAVPWWSWRRWVPRRLYTNPNAQTLVDAAPAALPSVSAGVVAVALSLVASLTPAASGATVRITEAPREPVRPVAGGGHR